MIRITVDDDSRKGAMVEVNCEDIETLTWEMGVIVDSAIISIIQAHGVDVSQMDEEELQRHKYEIGEMILKANRECMGTKAVHMGRSKEEVEELVKARHSPDPSLN